MPEGSFSVAFGPVLVSEHASIEMSREAVRFTSINLARYLLELLGIEKLVQRAVIELLAGAEKRRRSAVIHEYCYEVLLGPDATMRSQRRVYGL
jgi:hypothetical protein